MLDTTSGDTISKFDATESFRMSGCSDCGARPGVPWYAVQTEYRMPEGAVAQRLERPQKLPGRPTPQPFLTLLPVVTVRRRRGTKMELVNEAMFRRFLFVQFDVRADQWRTIAHARGVRHILGAGPEKPTPIPQRVIDFIMGQEYHVGGAWGLENGRVRRIREDPRPTMIAVGAQVRITRGAFSDHLGVCVMSAANRLRILLDMFGKEVMAERDQVEEVRESGEIDR